VPKVSVCIPTYNTAKYLPEAIESALKQEYADFELVVCDNASTDGTPELCQRYADPRLRYVRHEQLVGQAENWNRCLDLARGDYVILLHADDVLLPPFLSRAAEVMGRDAAVGLVHCAVQHIDPDGAPMCVHRLYDEDRIDPGEVRFRQLLEQGCLINPAGVLVRRTIYEAVGRFTTEIVWGVDWHMWLRASLRGPVGYLAEPLALYRQHPHSGTSGVMATGRTGPDELWAMEDVFRGIPAARKDLLALRRRARARVAHRTWCHAEAMCRAGFPAAARVGIRKAVAIHAPILLRPSVWGLLAATYVGYGWFERIRGWKRALTLSPAGERP
jgi:glycosyltransferase involved in cell wall biosynthesis